MFANYISAWLNKRNIHYAWVVLIVTFITMLVTACALSAPGALMINLEKEFGWNKSEISSALAVRFVLYGLLAPFAASLMRDYGIRNVVIFAITLTFLGIAGSFFMTNLVQLFIFWGVLVGCGTGMTAMVLGATIANNWFHNKRGLIMGIFSASGATGQLIFLPFIAKITADYGWRNAILLVIALLFFALLLAALLLQNKPANLGLLPYGANADDVENDTPQVSKQNPISALFSASKSGTFWVLFLTFFICGASTNGLIQTHFIAYCSDMGLAIVASASILALMGIFDLFGTIGSGYLSDRVDPRILLFVYYFLRGLSLLYLPNADFTIAGLSPFAIFYGLDWIATVPPTYKLTIQKFGRENGAIVFGWIFAGHQLGAASIAFFAGWSRTAFDTYFHAFMISGILCIIAAIMALFANGFIKKAKTI